MSPKTREVFRLYGQGYSYREIIEKVELESIEGVHRHIRNAARALGHDDLNARALLKVAIEAYVQGRIEVAIAAGVFTNGDG